MVVVKERGHRKSQHVVAHGKVHEDEKENDGKEKPSFQLRRFMVLQSLLFRLQFGHTPLGGAHGFGAVACLFHRLYHVRGRSTSFYSHGIGEEGYRHLIHPRYFTHRFFHMGLAGGTGHAGHHVLTFIFTH